MATFTKFNAFVEHLAEGVHNLGSHQLVVALSNDAPDPATDAVLADLPSQISYTNLSSRNLVVSSSAQTSGTYRLIINDIDLTATGVVGPFRYVIIYNSQSVGVTNAMIGYYDYGSSITLQTSEKITLDFDPVNGILSLT